MSIRDATLYYLNKSLGTVGGVITNGKDETLFGTGTQDVVFNTNSVFLDSVPQYNTQNSLEFRNVTINEGVNVVGLPSSMRDKPFYLKVSGTLTVNGHLHMDGMGGASTPYASESGHTQYTGGLNVPFIFSASTKFGASCISQNDYFTLLNYGKSYPFFNFKVGLTGSGCSFKTKDYENHHRYGYGQWCGSFLNGGGIPHQGSARDNTWGEYLYRACGGGFLALYYEDLNNQYAKTYTTEDGNTVPLNIHSNSSNYLGRSPFNGGGMMVIAARNIVIGPKGSITCDGGANADGGCGFLNYPSNAYPAYGNPDSYDVGAQLIFNGGNVYKNTDFVYTRYYSGGSGVCLGYQVSPRYIKVNH